MSGASERRLPRSKVEDKYDYEYLEEPIAFFDSVSGKFKSRVERYGNAAQFPQMPLYQPNEVVYLRVEGQQQPAGPYVVTRAEESGMYRIRRQDNSQEHPHPVREDQLVVRV